MKDKDKINKELEEVIISPKTDDKSSNKDNLKSKKQSKGKSESKKTKTESKETAKNKTNKSSKKTSTENHKKTDSGKKSKFKKETKNKKNEKAEKNNLKNDVKTENKEKKKDPVVIKIGGVDEHIEEPEKTSNVINISAANNITDEETSIDDIDFYTESDESENVSPIDKIMKKAEKEVDTETKPPKIEIDPLVGLSQSTKKTNSNLDHKDKEKLKKNDTHKIEKNMDLDNSKNIDLETKTLGVTDEIKEAIKEPEPKITNPKEEIKKEKFNRIETKERKLKTKSGFQIFLNLLLILLTIIFIALFTTFYLLENKNETVLDSLDKVFGKEKIEKTKINEETKTQINDYLSLLQNKITESTNTKFALDSLAYLFVDSEGDTLFSKNPNAAVFPASTTKLSTALIALDNLEGKLDDLVEVKPEDLILSNSYVLSGLKPGDKISVRSLIESGLLPSNNDSMLTLMRYVSEVTSKNQDQLFQEFIAKLQLQSTNYTNPYGGQEHNHYTSAADQIKIIRYANTKPLIREITKKASSEVKYTDKTGAAKTLKLKSTNLMLDKNSKLYDPNVFGYKTGSTDKAGYCLLSGRTYDGKEIYGAVFGTTSDENRFKLTKEVYSKIQGVMKKQELLKSTNAIISQSESFK